MLEQLGRVLHFEEGKETEIGRLSQDRKHARDERLAADDGCERRKREDAFESLPPLPHAAMATDGPWHGARASVERRLSSSLHDSMARLSVDHGARLHRPSLERPRVMSEPPAEAERGSGVWGSTAELLEHVRPGRLSLARLTPLTDTHHHDVPPRRPSFPAFGSRIIPLERSDIGRAASLSPSPAYKAAVIELRPPVPPAPPMQRRPPTVGRPATCPVPGDEDVGSGEETVRLVRAPRKTVEDFVLLDSDDSSQADSSDDDDDATPLPAIPAPLPPAPPVPPPCFAYTPAVQPSGAITDLSADPYAADFAARVRELRSEQRSSVRRERWAYAQWKRLTRGMPHPAERRIADNT